MNYRGDPARGARLGFQKVDEPTPGRTAYTWISVLRMSMPKSAAHIGGGYRGRRGARIGDSFRWVVMADPAGNVFCVAGQ